MPVRGRNEHLQRLTVTKSDTCAPVIAPGRRRRRLEDWSAGRLIDTAITIAHQGRLRTPEVTTQTGQSAVGLIALLAAAASASALVTTIKIIIAVMVTTAAVIATGMPMTRRLERCKTLCRRLSVRRVR